MTINKVFFLVIIFALLISCVSAIFIFSRFNHDIAYADNGIVNNNILLDSDLFNLYGSTSGSRVDLGSWFMQVGSCTLIENVFTSSSQYGQLSQSISNVSNYIGQTLTLTFSLSNVTGRLGIVIYSNTNIAVNNNITTGGVYSITGTIPNNTASFRVVLQNINTASSSCTINFAKLEFGSSFTGYVPKDYSNYGYNQGFEDAYNENQQGLLTNYVLYNKLDMFSLPIGSDSFFTYNNLNYRFNYSTSNNLFLETNVNLSWPLGSNGDANHRYMGFRFVDVSMPQSGCLVFYTSQSTYSGYFVFDNHTSSPFIVSLKDLQVSYQTDDPFSDYPLYCYYIYFDLPNASNIDLYYLSSIDTLLSNAGDSVLSTLINVYSYSDTNNYYQGYLDGKNTGYWTGYNQAYSEFDNDADYSFFGLLSAVIDTPIHAVGSMLDFELFGYNMKTFLITIISICIILVVAKFIIGLVL